MEDQLRQAIAERDLPTVRRILQGGGVNVNAGDQDLGRTFLHHAASAVHLRIVQAVLQANGVHVDAKDHYRITPLHVALRRGSNDNNEEHLQVVQALLDAGADPNAAGRYGEAPLFRAVCPLTGGCQIRVVEELLNRGANPAAREMDNLDTPLHYACRAGRLDIVELLIQRQGSECLTLKNYDAKTPLDLTDAFFIGEEPASSIQKHILQCFAGMIAQRRGLLCLHSVLQEATFIIGNEEDGSEEDMYGNEYIVRLAVGKLISENLQILLEYIIAAEPGSVRALDRDGLLPLQVASLRNFPPLQVASLRNFPDLVLNVLLRSYPDALL